MSAGFFGGTSLIAGMFDGIVRPIVRIFDILNNLPNVIISALSFILSSFLYGIQMGLFILIDMVQSVFRKIAGLDIYWYKESSGTFTQQEGDIVESFIHSDTVWNIFLSVLIAAIVLLFVSTIIAILKTELNEKDNAKGPVIKNALKAVAYFVMVPVVCFFGVALANIFLRSFDSATANKGAVSISGQIFIAASFNSNRIRNSHLAHDSSLADVRARLNGVDGFNIRESTSRAELADALDTAFAHNYSTRVDKVYTFTDANDYMAGYNLVLGGPDTYHKTNFDKLDISLTYYYYDLLSYNYLIGLWVSGIIIMLLLNLMIGVIQRIFDLTILFIVSPAFIATMPLDDGSRYRKWKETFIAKTLGCYGPIVGINLAFTILTLTQRIYIFDPAGGALNGLFNSLIQCIFVIVAVLSIKDFGKLVNQIVGGDDMYNNKAGDVLKAGGQIAGLAVNAAATGAKVAKATTIAGAKLGRQGYEVAKSGAGATKSWWNKHKANKELDEWEEMADNPEKLGELAQKEIASGNVNYSDRIRMQRDFESGMTEAMRNQYNNASAEDRTKMVNQYIGEQIRQQKVDQARGNAAEAQADYATAKTQLKEDAKGAAKASAGILKDVTNKNIKDIYGSVKNFSDTAGAGKYVESFNKAGGAQGLKDLTTHSIDAAVFPFKKAYDIGDAIGKNAGNHAPYSMVTYVNSEKSLNKIGDYFKTAGSKSRKEDSDKDSAKAAAKSESASKAQELKLLSDILSQLKNNNGGGSGGSNP